MSISISTVQKISQYKQYSKRAFDFEHLFNKVKNKGGGDCLFRSMAQHIYNDESKHGVIRDNVCNYYKTFDMQKSYPENSLEYKLQITLICEEFDSNGLRIDETTGKCISKENVWGSAAELEVIREYKLFAGFPVSVSQVSVAYDNNDSYEEFDVEFAYQYHTSTGGNNEVI